MGAELQRLSLAQRRQDTKGTVGFPLAKRFLVWQERWDLGNVIPTTTWQTSKYFTPMTSRGVPRWSWASFLSSSLDLQLVDVNSGYSLLYFLYISLSLTLNLVPDWHWALDKQNNFKTQQVWSSLRFVPQSGCACFSYFPLIPLSDYTHAAITSSKQDTPICFEFSLGRQLSRLHQSK